MRLNRPLIVDLMASGLAFRRFSAQIDGEVSRFQIDGIGSAADQAREPNSVASPAGGNSDRPISFAPFIVHAVNY